MRYRLLASYQGAPYEAGIGPDDAGVVLFAACPPPEDLHFEPATGHWRKKVSRADVQMLYQSRPVGTFRGERCVVLDDLTDRLHIAYLGHDAYRAEQLGFWEVDRGVFELITPRQEVSDIVEQRLPLALRSDGGARAVSDAFSQPIGYGPPPANVAGAGPQFVPAGLGAGEPDLPGAPVQSRVSIPAVDEPPLPLEAEAMRAATAAARRSKKNQPKHGARNSLAADSAGSAGPTGGASAARLAEAPAGGPPVGPGAGPTSERAAGLAEPVPVSAPAAAAISVTPAGLSEPSGAVNHGGDTSAVPSWTPNTHVPPPRPSQATAGPAAEAPPAPAEMAPPAQTVAPAPAEAQVPPAQATPQAPATPSAQATVPAQAASQARASSVLDSAPIHGVPLPMPANPAGQSPVQAAVDHQVQGPGSADQPRSGQSSGPQQGHPAGPPRGRSVNGVTHYGAPAAQALLESAHPATYMLDQLELPRPTSAGSPPSAQAGSSLDSPAQFRRDERPLGPETALTTAPPADADIQAGPAHASATGTATAPAPADPGAQPTPRRRRASRRRLPTQRIFSELAAQAGIPENAYAIGEDVDGAMCLVSTGEGFEVFNSLSGARHEVRVFQDEESAYFYLFGVLAAEAVRTGVLARRP